MKQNQYILFSEEKKVLEDSFVKIKFENYFLYKDEQLESYDFENRKVRLLLLGFIINPYKPQQSSQEIVQYLGSIVEIQKLFKELENFSGRYVVLYKNEKDFVLFHDMFGQRQINYSFNNSKTIISSSVKLITSFKDNGFSFIPNHNQLKVDKGFQLFDQWFLGDLTWDRDVKKLLPNHFMDLKKLEVKRLPFFEKEKFTEKDVIDKTYSIVKGNFDAVIKRYEIIFQALTSGYDSRTLLALSKDHWENIRFYTFKRGDANSNRDARIAEKLSKQFQFNYQSVPKLFKNFQFEEEYNQNFIVPRNTPKFYNVLYFKQFSKKRTVNITGDGVQMVRNLRSPEQLDSAELLFDSLGYSHHIYHLESFKNWLQEAKIFANENEIRISDLFTQEIAQGQLTARWAHEFDLSGCEEFNPFNHKDMIFTILKNIPFHDRVNPHYIFQKKLMENAVQGISHIPFNPPTWKSYAKKLFLR